MFRRTQFDRELQVSVSPDDLFSDFLNRSDDSVWYTDGTRTETG